MISYKYRNDHVPVSLAFIKEFFRFMPLQHHPPTPYIIIAMLTYAFDISGILYRGHVLLQVLEGTLKCEEDDFNKNLL